MDRQSYRFQKWLSSFVAGGVGLSLAFSVTHPLDTIKVRMQAKQYRSNQPPLSLLQLLRSTSRGMVASVAGAGPQGAIRLSTYEFTKHQASPLGMIGVVVAAVIGDLTSSVVKVPREVVISKVQVQGGTPLSTLKQIVRHEGAGGLYRGFWSTTLRDCPFMVILFSSHEMLKPLHQNSGAGYLSIMAGGFCGAFAAFFTTPFDVCKTRIMTASQNIPQVEVVNMQKQITRNALSQFRSQIINQVQLRSINTVSRPQLNLLQVSKDIYRQQGLRGFFVGAVPRSLWWLAVCSIFFPTYERTKDYLDSV